jgi:hypothetical protein
MLESIFRTCLGAYSQAGGECAIESNWERPGEHALGNGLGGVLGSELRVYFGAYSQAGRECVIGCNWECI